MRHCGKRVAYACLTFLLALLATACTGERAAAKLPTYTNSVGMEFVLLPAGSVKLTEEGRTITATISKPFYMGRYEVTQEQWQRVMPAFESNPARNQDDLRNPVEYVAWHEAEEFIRRLNEKEGHKRYRLPTEAEWEYAARAGSDDMPVMKNASTMNEYAWHDDNSSSRTHPVGLKKPNPWGLYDMYGNVSEWVMDWYAPYPDADVVDYQGPPTSEHDHVFRGGNYFFPWYRQHDRFCFIEAILRTSFLGFRVVLMPEEGEAERAFSGS